MRVKAHPLEKQLLEEGYSYQEIEELLSVPWESIKIRNWRAYKVDLDAAFAARVIREGVPNKLSEVDQDFARWFTGFFDGEGHLGLYKPKDYQFVTFSVGIELRDDDESVIFEIDKNIPNGFITRRPQYNNDKPQIRWKLCKITSLVEVIVPLFETYPLKTKKNKEFLLWKEAILRYYQESRGGKRHNIFTADQVSFYSNIQNQIQIIRKYK